MADVDILNHYGLQSMNPQQWPQGLFDEPEASNESQWKSTAKARKRMTTLGRVPSLLDSDPRSHKASVHRDEPDPLGTSGSVVKTLQHRGLPVDDDPKLRNTFLLSSVTFNPARYLSEVHSDATTEDLIRGLDYLSQSIEQKSASLKVLVESNFERFLRAKATIDNVYKEMRNHGADSEEHLRKPHSRQTSRNNPPHFRSASGNAGLNGPISPNSRAAAISERRRYALAKDTEHGTMGVKLPLLEAAIKADEIWGPAMGDKGKEEELKTVLDSIDKHKDLFDHASALDDCVRRNDYEGLVEEYAAIEKSANEARALAERAQQSGQKPSDSDLYQMILTSRIWLDVQSSMESVRRSVWSKLLSSHDSRLTSTMAYRSDDPMDLMAVLLQLGVSDNPISAWLQSHEDHLHYKIVSTFERFRVELEIMRRRLLSTSKPSSRVLAMHLRTASDKNNSRQDAGMDSPHILRYWEKIQSSLEALLSTKMGILGEVLEFCDTAQGFIEGRKQRNLPIGANGQSKKHHRLDKEVVANLQVAPARLCALIRDQLHKFFLQEPVEDVSSLFSPMPPTPKTPATPGSAMSPSRLVKFNFRSEDIPPPSPKLGIYGENLAFWPPHTNSLSASTMLGSILTQLATAAGEMTSISSIKTDEHQVSAFRILISDIRERFNTTTCEAWKADSANCRELEDWTKSVEKPDITNLPAYFNAWESLMQANLQKIVYISDAAGSPGSSSVIVPPSTRHLEAVQSAFRNSLVKTFDGMMQFARRPGAGSDNTIPASSSSSSFTTSDPLITFLRTSQTDTTAPTSTATTGTTAQPPRLLLTISNFQHLRSVVVPSLVSTFESHFSTANTTASTTADTRYFRDSLGQMSSQLFKAYLKPTLQRVDALIFAGIGDPLYTGNGAGKPDNAKPYVFEVLGCLVRLHTEISATTPGLTGQVLSHCLEHISGTLIEAFTRKPAPFPLPTLTQATLDVEFLAQTLNTYTTDRCSEIQGKIYLAMDEKTDNESRLALQKELPEMRAVLKRLREGTRGGFGCFRRVRGSAGGAGGGGGGGAGGGGRERGRGRVSE